MIRQMWRTATGVALSLGLTAVAAAAAQGPAPPGQDGFHGVPKGELGQEQLPAAPLVFAAYAFVWVVLIVYVISLWRRLTSVERELSEVSSRLQAKR